MLEFMNAELLVLQNCLWLCGLFELFKLIHVSRNLNAELLTLCFRDEASKML